MITQNSLAPTWDHTAGVKWITWDSNQWISYDDTDTFQQKKVGYKCSWKKLRGALDSLMLIANRTLPTNVV